MAIITVEGRQVSFAEAGAGRPLVLIHGYPLNQTMWEPQLLALAGGARVIALDLWGFGGSAPVTQADMGTYADQVRGLLDGLKVSEKAVICGLSMGGYVTFEFYRRYADRVAGLIFANTKAGPDSAEGKAGRDGGIALVREKGPDAIAVGMLPKMLSLKTYTSNPALVAQVDAILKSATVEGIVAALGAMRDRPDSTPTLAQIDMPALVIGGEDDQLFPRSEPEKTAGGIKRSRLVMLPGAGHLSNLEQPELFNRAVREFLAGT